MAGRGDRTFRPTRRGILLAGAGSALLPAWAPVSQAAPGDTAVFASKIALPDGLARRLVVATADVRQSSEFVLQDPDRGPIPLRPIEGTGFWDETTAYWVHVFDFVPSPQVELADLMIAGHAPRPVALGDARFGDATAALLRTLAFQRCGNALADAQTGLRRRPCHIIDRALEDGAGKPHDVSGGWHDGPGYSKSTVVAAQAIGTLSEIGEPGATLIADGGLGLPDSGNGVPDLVDLLRPGADWLLAMQLEDGRFFAGVASDTPPQIVRADQDGATRRLLPPTVESTAVACAALASFASYLARLGVSEPDGLGATYRQAALKGLKALGEENASLSGRAQTLVLATRLALAAEEDAIQVQPTEASNLSASLGDWPPAAALSITRVLFESGPGDHRIAESIGAQLVGVAEASLASDPHLRIVQHGQSSDLERDIRHALLQLAAYRLTAERRFLTAAAARADVMLGANRFGQVLVSGFDAPHPPGVFESQSLSLKLPVPGMAYAALGIEGEHWFADKGTPDYAISLRAIEARPTRLSMNAALAALFLGLDMEQSASFDQRAELL